MCLILVSASTLSVACQTTRRPMAIKSADSSSMTVQVSDDKRSLLWSGQSSAKDVSLKAARAQQKGSENSIASLQMHAELALVGNLPKAASENARSILRADFKNVRALKTLIKAALLEKNYFEAQTLSETAVQLAPQDAEIYSLQGLVQLQLNRPLYARALWKEALAIDPLHIPTLMNMGVMMFQNGHTAIAGAHFDKVLAVVPQHLDAQVGKALVLSAQGNAESAVMQLEGILKKTGENALLLENLALISRDRLKDYPKANAYVERTLALGKSDRRVFETAVGMKQELRRLMSSQNKPLNDESLRELAASGTEQAVSRGESTVRDNSVPSSTDLSAMEESLK
jgi:tetratricopeptide (TPR) repeat protein